MKTKKLLLALIAVGVLCASGYGLYSLGKHQGAQQNSSSNTPAGSSVDPQTGKRVLYWHDPMVPGHKFDKPGKSPFMDMDLVPVYADKNGEAGKVSISPQMQQSLGIRTAEVKLGVLKPAPEQDVVLIQARANGYLERLYFSRNPLESVRKGQALAELFVPDWVAAQEEYFAVRRMGNSAPAGLLEGAQQRMRLAGMLDQQIQTVQASNKVQRRFTITAPVEGFLTLEPAAREGTTVMPGTPLFRITRTDSQSSGKEVLLIPSEALIQTGKRIVVITVLDDGSFKPVEVEVGLDANGQVEIHKGLDAGQKVVVSGQFLIDSEASLKGVETRMNAASPSNASSAPSKTTPPIHRGTGKIEKIDKDEITISHGPISSLKWGAMTMGFKLPSGGLPRNLAVGDTVAFEIRQTPDDHFQITSVAPAAKPASDETKGAIK